MSTPTPPGDIEPGLEPVLVPISEDVFLCIFVICLCGIGRSLDWFQLTLKNEGVGFLYTTNEDLSSVYSDVGCTIY